MIGSIITAETGMQGFEQGLQTISNNTANLNTPGFKGQDTQFAELTDNAGGFDGRTGYEAPGMGLETLGAAVDFSQGQLQTTNNPLDLAINGQGFFVLQNSDGGANYSQDGRFKFDDSGTLVSTTTGEAVLGVDASGALSPISIAGQQFDPAQATTTVTFSGNLSSTATTDTVSDVTVIDKGGTSHSLTLTLTPVSGQSGHWTAALTDGSTAIGSQTLIFNGGAPAAGSSVLLYTYTPPGGSPMSLNLDFSNNVSSFDTGSSSTLGVASQDGVALGTLSSESFDGTGTLVLTYSNGKTVKKDQLAIAQFNSVDDVRATDNGEYTAKGSEQRWTIGTAGTGQFGTVQANALEGANVDLSAEFSNLVIMQRGYQACSQVISTSGDMLTALFGITSK